jgi:hypothetical protein
LLLIFDSAKGTSTSTAVSKCIERKTMKNLWIVSLACVAMVSPAQAQQGGAGATALTIYNQDFAVARTTVDLNLKSGLNEATTTNVTSQLEPDSVVLRDPTGKIAFKVSEQDYDAAVVNQEWMLRKYEGKTIQFSVDKGEHGEKGIVEGKIIRAGQQPLIEINGVMQFQLPGLPLFPATTDGLLLQPTLRWQIYSPTATHVAAELAYITHGMGWQATYNVVTPESKDVTGVERGEIMGWVTIQNNSGTEFPQARIKLMAGDVAKIRETGMMRGIGAGAGLTMYEQDAIAAPPEVTQQAFDDFHLYDLNRTVTLRAGETKQVDFLQASDVTMNRVYEYDGSGLGAIAMYSGYHNVSPNFGNASNAKVGIHEEIKNSAANHMGMPLPAGRIRMYRRDAGGQMEFIGEGTIGHTPAESTIKVPIGSAFDVTGERKQTDFHTDNRARTTDESYEITLKNQKSTAVHVLVVEHLNRGQNWQFTVAPGDFSKRDSNTVEIPVDVPAAGQTKVTYSVHYTW